MVRESFKSVLDFVFPPLCSICGRTDTNSKYALLCNQCIDEFRTIEPPFCSICGSPFVARDIESHPCPKCLKVRPSFDKSRSAGIYEGSLEKAIKSFKYKNKRPLYKPLADFMTKKIRETYSEFDFDFIVPVPLSRKRLRQRGFHNAYLLAKIISDKYSIPVDYKNLIKHKETKPQVELKFKERKTNISGSFKIKNSELFKGKSILLIDDVFTTGATLNECARILKKDRNAKKVKCFTLAKTIIGN